MRNRITVIAAGVMLITALGFGINSAGATSNKITICHVNPSRSVTLKVDANGWNGHDDHPDDYEGECQLPTTTTAKPTTTTTEDEETTTTITIPPVTKPSTTTIPEESTTVPSTTVVDTVPPTTEVPPVTVVVPEFPPAPPVPPGEAHPVQFTG